MFNEYHENTDAFLRMISIDIITDEPNPIIDWVYGIWNSLSVLETEEDIFYYSDNVWKFVYDKIENTIITRYDIWNFIYIDCVNEKYNLGCGDRMSVQYDTTQTILTYIFNNASSENAQYCSYAFRDEIMKYDGRFIEGKLKSL